MPSISPLFSPLFFTLLSPPLSCHIVLASCAPPVGPAMTSAANLESGALSPRRSPLAPTKAKPPAGQGGARVVGWWGWWWEWWGWCKLRTGRERASIGRRRPWRSMSCRAPPPAAHTTPTPPPAETGRSRSGARGSCTNAEWQLGNQLVQRGEGGQDACIHSGHARSGRIGYGGTLRKGMISAPCQRPRRRQRGCQHGASRAAVGAGRSVEGGGAVCGLRWRGGPRRRESCWAR